MHLRVSYNVHKKTRNISLKRIHRLVFVIAAVCLPCDRYWDVNHTWTNYMLQRFMSASITLRVRLSPPRSHGAFQYKALECYHRLGEIAPVPIERMKGPSLHCRNTTLHSEFNSDESACRSAYPRCVLKKQLATAGHWQRMLLPWNTSDRQNEKKNVILFVLNNYLTWKRPYRCSIYIVNIISKQKSSKHIIFHWIVFSFLFKLLFRKIS